MGDTADATVVQRRHPPRTTGGSTGPDSVPPTPPEGTPEPGSASAVQTKRLTYSTPAETLRAEELLRTRVFARVVIVLIAMIFLILPFLGGDLTYKWIMVGALTGTVIANIGLQLYLRDETRYRPDILSIPAVFTILGGFSAVNYFGFYSPAPMVLVFGVYFISLGQSTVAALLGFIAVAGAQAIGSILVARGILPDRGLIAVGQMRGLDLAFILVAEQMVFVITFVLGRLSRKATETAMERLEKALRQVGQREALLAEAKLDLERALKPGGQGRFSGERVSSWKLGELIGRGAMGEVYEAVHQAKSSPAAVKLLHAHTEGDAEQLKRFLREAEVMSQLDSPHVVKIYDVGFGADGPPFIAMERLAGHDLAWHLRKRRKLPTAKVVELVTQVASALDKARQNEIVHRDLKPQNLFLCEGEQTGWKILDFGVSKLGARTGTLTRGHVVGTPGYMAPEQARGQIVDHRADVFALAVIAYRCLTGRPAFSGEDYPKIMFDLVYVQPVRPTEIATMPLDVDFALAVGLAKRPKDRFQTAVELADALRAALAGELPASIATRGHAILAKHPWGQRVNDDDDGRRTPTTPRKARGDK